MGLFVQLLNQTYFADRLSPAVLAQLNSADLDNRDPGVQAFATRFHRFMHSAGIDATHYPEAIAQALVTQFNVLPSALSGIIPPITFQFRHRKIDDYLACTPWLQAKRTLTFLDVGCGFPPLGAIEVAERFPHWQVIGADPQIPHYVVHDSDGSHATFDADARLIFCSPGPNREYWRDLPRAREYFEGLLNRMLPALLEGETGLVEWDGRRLVSNPVKQYETANLSYAHAGFGEVEFSEADLVRSFNVMNYFDRPFRQRALDWVTKLLRDGGLFMVGNDGPLTVPCRYTLYRKEAGRLAEREFSFSIDNLRMITRNWMAQHDDCYETNLLAQTVATVRKDEQFRLDFDRRVDLLLAEHQLSYRNEEGYLTSLPLDFGLERIPHVAEINEQLDQEGYVAGAVEVLQRAGYEAWRNCAGHISIAP